MGKGSAQTAWRFVDAPFRCLVDAPFRCRGAVGMPSANLRAGLAARAMARRNNGTALRSETQNGIAIDRDVAQFEEVPKERSVERAVDRGRDRRGDLRAMSKKELRLEAGARDHLVSRSMADGEAAEGLRWIRARQSAKVSMRRCASGNLRDRPHARPSAVRRRP